MLSQHKNLMILIWLLVFSLTGIVSSYAESGGSQPGTTGNQPPPTPGILLPDLKPTSLYFNADCDLMAEIANEGPGDFNGEVGYRLDTNEVPPGGAYGTFDLDLAAGEKKTLLLLYEAQIRFPFPEQNHQLTLWINPPAANYSEVFGFPHVFEASEANNRLTVETKCEGEGFHTLETVGGVPDLVPELIVREIPREPPTNGSPYTRQWTGILLVTNKGTGTAAGEFRVTGQKFTYSDWEQAPFPRSYPFDVTFDRLRPGHHVSYWLNVLYWAPGGSRVGYQVTVDPDNASSESNENNNSAEKWFPTLNLPKSEWRQVTMIGKIRPEIFVFCPDIVISIYRTRCDCEQVPIYEWQCVKWDPPGPPGPGSVCLEWGNVLVGYETECEVKVSYVVKNIGTQDAGVFHVKLESSTGHTGTDYFSGLLVDEEKYHHWLYFTTDDPGSVTAAVTADIDDEVTECDENNNTDSATIDCK